MIILIDIEPNLVRNLGEENFRFWPIPAVELCKLLENASNSRF